MSKGVYLKEKRKGLFQKGHKVPNKWRRKISEAHKGTKKPWAGRYNHSNNKGNFSKEHPAYKYWLGRERSEKTRKKISKTHKEKGTSVGKKNPMYGKRGKLSPAWKGGISNKPYPFDFNERLKKLIRRRDNYICQLCKKTELQEKKEIKRKLSVHHIDYNKSNINFDNLITLCGKCNSIVNFKRSDWINYFKITQNNGISKNNRHKKILYADKAKRSFQARNSGF